jgi:peroxiredoxin
VDFPGPLPHKRGMTKRPLFVAAAVAAVLSAVPGSAALPQGARAPQIATQGALAGKTFNFNLRQALRRGPVVLYFFPKAFTQGCTLEAHAFAEAADDFKAAGAQVIGMSADDLPTLQRFSTEECRNAFPVAIASPGTIRAYDVDFQREGKSTGLTNRTSYVIGRDGKVVMVHSDLNYADHVAKTLAAVKALPRT